VDSTLQIDLLIRLSRLLLKINKASLTTECEIKNFLASLDDEDRNPITGKPVSYDHDNGTLDALWLYDTAGASVRLRKFQNDK